MRLLVLGGGPAGATEAVGMAAQKACRAIGIGRFPPSWSYLGQPE